MLVQESRGEKACTSAHGAVAAAAAPERCSKTISGSTKDIALSSDSERLTVVIASGSQRGGGEKACTKVTTAAPEKCSKKFSALTKDTTLLSLILKSLMWRSFLDYKRAGQIDLSF